MSEAISYRWESGYEKSWEEIREDDRGLLPISDTLAASDRKRRREDMASVRLGMMRHLYVILDCSDAMTDTDFKPTRQMCTLKLLKDFVKEFLEQNPISQLGIIVTRDKRAEKLSELSGNARKHLESLEACHDHYYCKGEPSVQNALNLAFNAMKMLPSHASREILFISASLTTCDPGNISFTINALKSNSIRCSVIGLSASIHVLSKLCKETNGKYSIALNDVHFQELVTECVKPRVVAKSCEATCVKMGFPHQLDKVPAFSTCMCHMSSDTLNKNGYYCPQCCSKYCDLPIECQTCGITLATSAHLVRPLRHLIPVPSFEDARNVPDDAFCYACQRPFKEGDCISACCSCHQFYCEECDNYIHNTLNVCPGCATFST